MQDQSALFKLLFCTSLALTFLLCHGDGTISRCSKNVPSIKQTKVEVTRFRVDVQNNCGTCPVINIHVKCGRFPQALVSPELLKVLKVDDCVVNSGLPLAPLQTFSFNYSHPSKYPLNPGTWDFQCE